MSLVLRHQPEKIGLVLDENGWAKTADLLEKMTANGTKLTLEILQQVVENNNKKRFAFNEDGSKIRASQGHSIAVELAYAPCQPPEMLFHGTATRFIPSIQAEGLLKGKRHAVHLSKDRETAINVGKRHGKVIVLEVQAQKMFEAGFEFFVSENGVWLTDHVPVEYIRPLRS